jgi:heptosyltransferase I
MSGQEGREHQSPSHTMKSFAIRPPRSIAIVMLSALGDAVHVLPVANALKRTWPDTRITWIIQPVPFRLVEGHPAIDEFIVFHRRRGLEGISSFTELRSQLAGRRFDLVINLQVYFKAGLITAMLDAPIKLGFDRARARDMNWLFTTHRIPRHAPGHVQDQYFEFLEFLGVDPNPVEWRIPITAADREAQSKFFAELGGPALAVVVGTSRPAKNWPPERYAEALERIHEEHGLIPVIVGGPSATERETADAIKRATGIRIVDALGDDIRRLVWLLDGSTLVLSPDTGPLHVANALGKKVIGLYGYTNPLRCGPYGHPESVIDGYARSPDERYQPSMEYRIEGMDRVTVGAVVAAARRALASDGPHDPLNSPEWPPNGSSG